MIPPSRRGLRTALLLFALLIFAGCDVSGSKVEILDIPPTTGPAIKIASSDEALPFFRKIAEGYAARKGIRIEVFPAQSRDVPELLRTGAVDLGVTAGGIPAGVAKMELSYVPFAHDAIAFVASRDAGVTSLTIAQIRRIWAGEVTDWRQVGGKSLPIRIVDRPLHSTSRRLLAVGPFRGDFPEARGGVLMETSEMALQAMRELPGHIGFAPISRITSEHFPGTLLAIEGMPPRLDDVRHNPYPARVDFGLMFRRGARESVTEMADFFLSQEGWHQLATQGLIPAEKNLSLAACHCREQESSFQPAGKRAALAGTFVLAVVPELGAITQEERYGAICQRIANEMGVHARLLHLQTYDQVLNEFSDGRIDAAFVGSLMYGKLHARLGVVPLVRPEKDGVSHYRGLIVTRKDGGISSFAGLRGKRFAYVANTSAGELFARAKVAEEGGMWPGFFSRVWTVTSHQEAIALVRSGKVDGAAIKDLVLKRGFAASPNARQELSVVATSDRFPENALVVAATVGERERNSLRTLLLSFHRQAQGREDLKNLGADRMIPTVDQDYAGMYALARKIRYRLDVDE